MSMETNRAGNLYIYLGLDSIFSLNLNHLLSSDDPDLEKVLFRTDDDADDDDKESKYPPFKGLFVIDSKLHCIGNVAGESEDKVFTFNLPSLTQDQSTHFPCYHSSKLRPIVFTANISNKVYALETTPTLDRPDSFDVFEPQIGEWKSLPPPPPIPHDDTLSGEGKSLHPPPQIHLPTSIVLKNNILLQTCYGDFIFEANADLPNWKNSDNSLPRIFAALECQGFILILSIKPCKLYIYELASFGEKGCYSRVVDIWKDWRFKSLSELDIHWASLNLAGNNLISIVFLSNDKIHVTLIRFMKTFRYANLEAYHEFFVPDLENSSDTSFYSTFIWGTDISCHETIENPTISSENLTEADQIEDYSMDHNQGQYLYIYLGGFGALWSLNFNELYKKDSDSKSDLRLLFSHHNRGKEIPIGRGLFALGSKLHFFGGENLEVSKKEMFGNDYVFLDFVDFVGLKAHVRPKYFKYWYGKVPYNTDAKKKWISRKSELIRGWFNQKVFSFNLPYFTSCDSDTAPAGPSSCKVRPVVFTISNRIYALSTKTVSYIGVKALEDYEGELKLLEVFEPEKNEWHHIDNDKLPSKLYQDIRDNTLEIESHCVFGDKMLLQTSKNGGSVYQDYVFDSASGDWDDNTETWYPKIYSALEYNNKKLLLVISRYPVELLVYELASFGKEDSDFGKLNIVDERKKDSTFGIVVDDDNYFPGPYYVCGASLNLIDHKHISLVLFTKDDIRVSVLKVEAPFRYAKLVAHRVFDVPKNCLQKIQPYSTFLLGSDVNQHEHNDTKAAGPTEENSTLGEPESDDWELFKIHLRELYKSR